MVQKVNDHVPGELGLTSPRFSPSTCFRTEPLGLSGTGFFMNVFYIIHLTLSKH